MGFFLWCGIAAALCFDIELILTRFAMILLLLFSDRTQSLFRVLTCIRETPGLHLLTVKRCEDVLKDMSRWFGIIGVVGDMSLMSYQHSASAMYLLIVTGKATSETVSAFSTAAKCPVHQIGEENHDLVLALTGNPEPASFSAECHQGHGLSVPYFIPKFETFILREVELNSLLSTTPSQCLIPLSETPHVKFLQGERHQYNDYIACHIGKAICEDHTAEAFDHLADLAHFSYPHTTAEGDAAYILVKEVRNKQTGQRGYKIMDGNHRAAVLLQKGAQTALVAVISPLDLVATVPTPAPEGVHLDAFAFEAFGPQRVGSRKKARKYVGKLLTKCMIPRLRMLIFLILTYTIHIAGTVSVVCYG